jgi:hypothetical protein
MDNFLLDNFVEGGRVLINDTIIRNTKPGPKPISCLTGTGCSCWCSPMALAGGECAISSTGENSSFPSAHALRSGDPPGRPRSDRGLARRVDARQTQALRNHSISH